MSPTFARRSAAATALALALVAAPGRADFVIDLTSYDSSGTSQGALFLQANPQPTGTGVFDPFVRIQRTGTERGYNTDARPVEFDTKDQNHWTHSLALSDLAAVSLNGTDYYRFALDINEMGNDKGRLLSMNDFRLYLGDSPSLTGWNDGFGTHSVKVYDLDADARGDGTVELDYKLNSGSGSGDMFVYVPTSYFQGFGDQYKYVYLYSAFGQPNGSDAGFEEWAAAVGGTPPTNPVPAPAGVALALSGLASLGLAGLRRFRRPTPPDAPATA